MVSTILSIEIKYRVKYHAETILPTLRRRYTAMRTDMGTCGDCSNRCCTLYTIYKCGEVWGIRWTREKYRLERDEQGSKE